MTFPNFSLGGLRRLIGTGRAGEIFDSVNVVLAVRIDGQLYWLCHDCGGIDHLIPPAGLEATEAPVLADNPCPARNAPARVALRLRPDDAQAPTLGICGW